MIKCKTIAVALGMAISVSSYALSFPKSHKQSSANHLLQAKQSDHSTYIDFSGKWVGKCSDEDSEETIEISNDKDFITIDSEEYPIDGSKSVTTFDAYATAYTDTTSFYWDYSKKSLNVKSTFLDKRNGDADAYITLGTGTYKIIDDRLIVSGRYFGGIDDGIVSQDIQCIYRRA